MRAARRGCLGILTWFIIASVCWGEVPSDKTPPADSSGGTGEIDPLENNEKRSIRDKEDVSPWDENIEPKRDLTDYEKGQKEFIEQCVGELEKIANGTSEIPEQQAFFEGAARNVFNDTSLLVRSQVYDRYKNVLEEIYSPIEEASRNPVAMDKTTANIIKNSKLEDEFCSERVNEIARSYTNGEVDLFKLANPRSMPFGYKDGKFVDIVKSEGARPVDWYEKTPGENWVHYKVVKKGGVEGWVTGERYGAEVNRWFVENPVVDSMGSDTEAIKRSEQYYEIPVGFPPQRGDIRVMKDHIQIYTDKWVSNDVDSEFYNYLHKYTHLFSAKEKKVTRTFRIR